MPVTLLRFSWGTLLAALALWIGAAHAAGARQLVLYRPGNSSFYVKQAVGSEPARENPYGGAGDVPLWGDFNGDGKPDAAVYRNGVWLISTRAEPRPDLTITFGGQSGDIPLAADMDGDGTADLIIFRRGEWHIRGSRSPAMTKILYFGTSGDMPVLGDFDGDGKTDLAVFRSGQWFVDTQRDGKAALSFAFGGVAGERPLAVDASDSKRSVPALFRDGEWFISANHDGKVTEKLFFGAKGDIPLAIQTLK